MCTVFNITPTTVAYWQSIGVVAQRVQGKFSITPTAVAYWQSIGVVAQRVQGKSSMTPTAVAYWQSIGVVTQRVQGKSSMTSSHLVENCQFNCHLLAVILLKYPNGLLLVAVDRSQHRTVSSETEDPIDWPLPPIIHRAVPPVLHLHSATAGYKSQDLL